MKKATEKKQHQVAFSGKKINTDVHVLETLFRMQRNMAKSSKSRSSGETLCDPASNDMNRLVLGLVSLSSIILVDVTRA